MTKPSTEESEDLPEGAYLVSPEEAVKIVAAATRAEIDTTLEGQVAAE